MNNVEIVIDYYLHITSHVSHTVTSCTHFTSYFLLNLVHEIVCEFGLAIQDYMFYDFDAKYVHWLKFGGKMCYNFVFESFGLKTNVFEKLLNLYSCIQEINWFECFLHKTSAVFQNFSFSRILIDQMCFSTDRKSLEFLSLVLPGLIAPWLVLSINRNCFFRLIEY